jgi:hypothetical protein
MALNKQNDAVLCTSLLDAAEQKRYRVMNVTHGRRPGILYER